MSNSFAMYKIKSFYDHFAGETARHWYGNDLLSPTIQEFIALFKKRPRILDLGCGTGHESMRLFKEGAEVVGVDFSSESIRIAKERNPHCLFYEMDFFTINKTLGTFDGIFASGSFIHVPPSKMDELSNSLSDILCNHGYLEIILQIGKGEKRVKTKVKNDFIERIFYLYDKAELESFLKNYGFKFIKNGKLSKDLIENGWDAFIFQKR